MSESTARDPYRAAASGETTDPSRAADPSRAIVRHGHGGVDEPTALTPYRMPVPGRTWRSAARFGVLVGGSAAIGIGVATGGLTIAGAALLAVTLATGQVLAQTWRQNRLGQAVVGGIAQGDLEVALGAAERALVESPTGVMRTLAASNLASVLIQRDRVDEAAAVLDKYPPGMLHMPLASILWLNNRAFAHLALVDEDPAGLEAAGRLLAEAEKRLKRASARDLGGAPNSRKLQSALAGTRAIERVLDKDGRAALQYLKLAQEVDDGTATPYRTVERELCRAEALRLLGRADEATLVVEGLTETSMTPRQEHRAERLRSRLGLA